ncbi:unnamed protein product [Didymodactylos carnosus]|uniref:Uncharacterized protein n=1 Tax=Didymodactylos carnosus TaxID=1234261 RepID=A0A8S2ITK0_9BILA|nr:unnamed protein product [Didymodactylos carnosus]CAF3772955.1 unnamed protein product [Didymodactylos carnosus]CAF4267022.1 unnamed protein product [Didymodactylos carnosus]
MNSVTVSSGYHCWFPILLRWLGSNIKGNNIKIGPYDSFLNYPSNLLTIEDSCALFSGAMLVHNEVKHNGHCIIDQIRIGTGVTIGNDCAIHAGSNIPSQVIVGSMTRYTSETICNENDILLGIPASKMPFIFPSIERMDENE